MKTLKTIMITLVCLVAVLALTGCAGRGDQANNAQTQDQTVLIGFDQLVRDNAPEKEILAYIDANINKVTREGASQLATGFETRQKKSLEELDRRFAGGQEEKWTKTIPNGLQKEFGYTFSMERLEQVEDPELKKMLEEVRDTGYRVRSAEGMYFPVIDYQFYQKYYDYLTEDIKNYYMLMATESNTPPAVDAALVISPDEILMRILAQENYLKIYPGSAKLKDIEELYLRYVNFYLFGLNNTPAFANNPRVLRKDFQFSYNNFDTTTGGKFAAAFSGYREILKDANYILTDKVAQERQKVIEQVNK
ncbi:MAG: hypothetical protein PHD36_06310 [Desulfotomaculaceae bacterium]|nr:hypothetical protein [Desulfotomaculaceae bacterium]